MGSMAIAGALALSACGGDSESSDDGSGGEAGDPSGNGGSTGGTGARGGSGGAAGTPTGGTAGTGIDGVCEEITPCGGDPEGSWTVTENCAEVLVTGVVEYPGCEDVVGRGSAEVTGTFTFSSGVVIQNIVVTPNVTTVITDVCARGIVGSDMITAAQLCPVLDATLMNDPETPLRCSVTNEGCQCAGEQPPQTNMGTDTYMIVGNQLLIGGDTFDFCQEGDELHLHGTTVDATSGQSVSLTLLLERS
jgi:hypothetical protein